MARSCESYYAWVKDKGAAAAQPQAPHATLGTAAPPAHRCVAAPAARFCRGKLIYVDKEFKQDFTCSPPCKYACQDFSVGGGWLGAAEGCGSVEPAEQAEP